MTIGSVTRQEQVTVDGRLDDGQTAVELDLGDLVSGGFEADVDAIARRVIEQAGFGDNFGHSLGHGTGLCIHEAPRLSPHSEDTLAAGMIVTVEPGIYLPAWVGVRLENQVVITPNGATVLNSLDLDDHHLAFA